MLEEVELLEEGLKRLLRLWGSSLSLAWCPVPLGSCRGIARVYASPVGAVAGTGAEASTVKP